ncbi:OLC1v1004951C1 [Oldenlandia corymbosa var. corymbosa]|uniref:Aldose 1-epimerase n=1 Tax=Oldenlandia corymbosa var. corymbosa TaxID=529605 RepID=A0AAV1DE92_OLDCO|nr:OLC1v1004951C1 [Oldenlandia corymbosa var. corymbosa]
MASKISAFFGCHVLIGLLLLNLVSANEGTKIEVFELVRGNFSVKVTNYGATILSVILPDKNGKLDDVVLGYDTVDEYKTDSTYFGALIGRVANRIGGAKFKLNGVEYKLPANDHGNTLHGGPKGFDSVIWKVTSYQKDSHISLHYRSQDGEQGFPGEVDVSVHYMFVGSKTKSNRLAIRMEATPLDKATPINLATHSYWNLAGHNSGDILSHNIQIFASNITPVDKNLIPTGQITPVTGTAYDFLKSRAIGSRFNEIPGGYDINYVVDNYKQNGQLSRIVLLQDTKSGRKMELWSNKPGLQFYTSNMFDNLKGKNGTTYHKHAALCLETQGFPDSVNHPNFPSQIVNPGQKYDHMMIYKFTTR